MKSLIFVDKFFNGVESLTIVYRGPRFDRTSRKEKSAIESSLCEMTTLQMLNSLNLFYDEDVVFPIALPTLWKIFPNVTVIFKLLHLMTLSTSNYFLCMLLTKSLGQL